MLSRLKGGLDGWVRGCGSPDVPGASPFPRGHPQSRSRRLRRRELVRLLPGVFVDHTGVPTWRQRAWAGIHRFGPEAALDGRSALQFALGADWRDHRPADPIEIVVPASVRRREIEGYVVRRSRQYAATVLANISPPRRRIEHAAILVAAELDELAAIQLLADVCQSRRTAAGRLAEAAGGLTNVPRRRWLIEVADDIASGSCSVLEHGYLQRVERPHGLPVPSRQRQVRAGRRDVDYVPYRLVVELDGRLFHDLAAQRDVDLERDLDATVDREQTVRLGWGQVYDRPCRTAARIATVLRGRGWTGELRPCGAGCEAAELWKP
ncbi:MAG TPA: hypothetical protein VMF51_13060 [Nocardioides sp.]|uniref:hypothetical protein n=1 Tax=Nocardioides sp. TaxID=35761 RepID=UPI002BD9EA12|nr:hypothetical protein [Nocardioides sp.]HTW16057.1 hypothetical protein [Nocardioides sp.]